MRRRKKLKKIKIYTQGGIQFAHQSEAEFAKILDFYQVEWRYEPQTFPLQWKPDGQLAESFSPDFFLPDFEQYIEITTCKVRLMSKKKRKIRLLRELYPHVKIMLIQNQDFHHLMWKYQVK